MGFFLWGVCVFIVWTFGFETFKLLWLANTLNIDILGTHFGVDLTNRKAEVKAIIAEVISNMTDDDEEEESDGGDENKAAA